MIADVLMSRVIEMGTVVREIAGEQGARILKQVPNLVAGRQSFGGFHVLDKQILRDPLHIERSQEDAAPAPEFREDVFQIGRVFRQ